MYNFTGKEKPFFDGYEWMVGCIRRHGWTAARDIFNERFDSAWKPATGEQWQYSKGAMSALMETM